MTRSAHASSSPPRVIGHATTRATSAHGGGGGPLALGRAMPLAREGDSLLAGRRNDTEFATFCSISLNSEPRGSKSAIEEAARLQQQYLQSDTRELPRLLRKLRRVNRNKSDGTAQASRRSCCACASAAMWSVYASIAATLRVIRRVRFFALVCCVLFAAGIAGVVWAVCNTADADWYLFLGALVSFAFSLIVIVCYIESRAVRSHPNPLILSKSFVDLLLALLYVFEYSATQFTTPPVVLPVRIAAATQALLVCGEFWFFAMPIDMVQSITNPFTSYAHNNRVYWFYSVLSGVVCGVVLWLFDDESGTPTSREQVEVERFFWFHENTDRPGFWWHHWLSYHMWVVIYLVFATVCIVYVKRRLKRGLEETFDVRRRILSSGLLTCWIYISWSLVVLGLFVATNLRVVQQTVNADVFEDLVNLSAFLHSARGGLNIIVWLVINSSNLHTVCFRPATRHRRLAAGGGATASSHATASTASSTYPRPQLFSLQDDDDLDQDDEEQALINKPELNAALRRQMIQMATSGIVESVEHYHRLHRRIASNQTFNLDWQTSPQRRSRDVPRQLSASMSLSKVVATRNATIRVVEANDKDTSSGGRHGGRGGGVGSGGLPSFLPMRMKEMQFYDFQPRVFASIRQLQGIQDQEYVYAFRHTMNERMSEGRSGAFVFTTSDRKYLVKSTTAAEKNVLLGLLPSYLRYLKWNPRTLLPKFLGFHAMKMYGQVFYFVVMGNVLNTNEVIHRRYDLKGSWVDRNAPACVLGEKYRCSKCNRFFTFGVTSGPRSTPCEPLGSEHYADITLRDNDLKKRIKLESDTALQLVKQLTRDSNFLASLGIMDYSLLVGAHYSHFTITSEENGAGGAGGTTGEMRKEPSALHLVGMLDHGPATATAPATYASARRMSTMANDLGSGGVEASGYVHNLCDDEHDEQAEEDDCDAEDEEDEQEEVEEEASSPLNPAERGTPTPHGLAALAEASGTTVSASADVASPSMPNPHAQRHHHRYRAHQVSGPSTYYFGLVDILQKWTLAKQVERVYKVHVLRKAARGVSAIHPKAYATRFQQKVNQLLMTAPPQWLQQSIAEEGGDISGEGPTSVSPDVSPTVRQHEHHGPNDEDDDVVKDVPLV